MRIVHTWVAGRRSLLVEGILVSLEDSAFLVTQCGSSFSEMLNSSPPMNDRHLCIQIVETSDYDESELCQDVLALRRLCPEAVIVCIVNDISFDDARLMAAGVNGCVSGRLTSAEFKLLLTLIVSGGLGLNVVAAPKISAGEHAQGQKMVAGDIQLKPAEMLASAKPEEHDNIAAPHPNFSLSPREKEVLAGLINGESNKSLAKNLTISEATVKAHVRTVFRKLGAHSRTQAVRYFFERCPPGALVADWLVSHTSEHASSKASRMNS